MRECARLLIRVRENLKLSFIEILVPAHSDVIVLGAQEVAGYNSKDKTYRTASLALHYGATLKNKTDLARNLVIKKSLIFQYLL